MSDRLPNKGRLPPPPAYRFKKGESGNKKGRPRKLGNVALAVDKELDATIVYRENGQEKKATAAEILAKRIVAKALSGDNRTIAQLVALVPDRFRPPAGRSDDHPVDPDEAKILERFVARQLRLGGSSGPTSK